MKLKINKVLSITFIASVVSTVLIIFFCSAFFCIDDPRDKGSSDQNKNVYIGDGTETEKYISPEASMYLSEGYVFYGGDVLCSHEWEEWIMTKAATIVSTGSEQRTCEKCRAFQRREYGDLHGSGERFMLDVECIYQMPNYPNGCEVVSLTMALRYLGLDVSVDTLIDNHLKRGVYGNNTDDPFYQYLGNPRDLGVGCYAPCIVNAANSYLESKNIDRVAKDISGSDFVKYREYIKNGYPIIFWGTTYMDGVDEVFGTIELPHRKVKWMSHSHCFVMIGYTDTTYIFCDPLRGIIEYPKKDVETSHALVYKQACIIQ